MAAAGSVAFPFLRRNAARAGERSRTHLFRAFLDRLRRRSYPVRAGERPSDLRGSLRPTGRHASGLRELPRLRTGWGGAGPPRPDAPTDADADSDRRNGVGPGPDRPGPLGG